MSQWYVENKITRTGTSKSQPNTKNTSESYKETHRNICLLYVCFYTEIFIKDVVFILLLDKDWVLKQR